MKIAVIGATGMVGRVMLSLLAERSFHVSELILVASQKSIGNSIEFKKQPYTILSIEEALNLKPEIALFSAGSEVSLKWAPKFSEKGITVIDNSSAWRMDPFKKLIVPEINALSLNRNDKIIANPNCSTIQLVIAIAPLHKKYKIKRLIISTYQSVTGTGLRAVQQLENEICGSVGEKIYPHQIHQNAIPHCDEFMDNGYTKEEMKLINETKKILSDDSILITATAVRIPVFGGHSESVNIEFENDYSIQEIKSLLSKSKGIIVQDDPTKNLYPMPLYSRGKDDVYVGRIRRDESKKNCLNMWIVTDNLRKGAATNAIQIAEFLQMAKL